MVFSAPNFNGPLDTKDRIAQIPSGEESKGIMFIVVQEYVQNLTGKHIGKDRYNALASYPTTELITLMDEAALSISPSRPKEGLYHIGQQVLPKLKTVAAGTFIFGSIGTDIGKGWDIADRFYRVLSNKCTCKILEKDDHHSIMEVRNAWLYPTCFQVGIIESYSKLFGKTSTVQIEELGIFDARYLSKW